MNLTCASLIVPLFNTRYMKDSVAFRGSVLWKAMTNNCSVLTKNISYRDLPLKLKSLAREDKRGREGIPHTHPIP